MLRLIFAVLLLFLPAACAHGFDSSILGDGDLIFQETESEQAVALRAATGSPWTHVGLFFSYNGRPMVFEAVQPVRITPLRVFLARSRRGRFQVMRLVRAGELLTPRVIGRLKRYAHGFLGRDYDSRFLWDDRRLYCSEVIWKLYNRVLGVRIGKLRRFGSFNLAHPVVRQLIRRRYGGRPPLGETVIGPGDMAESPLLRVVYRSF